MRLDEKALQQLFLDARTYRAWQPRDVPDSLLEEVVNLMKMAPTANNSLPARIVFVKSKPAKERLKPLLSRGNVDKTMAAPATAIVAYDLKFYAHPPKGQEPLSKIFCRQAGAGADRGVPQRLPAGCLSHHGGARAGT